MALPFFAFNGKKASGFRKSLSEMSSNNCSILNAPTTKGQQPTAKKKKKKN
ncbi:hypothetical protein [Lacinutrix salivirga]